MSVVGFLIQSVRGAVVFARAVAAGGEGAEVLQERPAAQPKFRRPLVAVQAPAVVQKPRQAVHQTVHRSCQFLQED